MSRHQTLLSIYGSTSSPAASASSAGISRNEDGKERKRKLPIGCCKQIQRRPTSAVATVANASTTGNGNQKAAIVREVADAAAAQPSNPPPDTMARTAKPPCGSNASTPAFGRAARQIQSTQAAAGSPTPPHSATPYDASPVATEGKKAPTPSPRTRRIGRPQKSTSGHNRDTKAPEGKLALSLYGDGFLEIPPLDDQTTMLRDGFSIKIRLFKAADIQRETTQSYTEESRHRNPELGDAGESFKAESRDQTTQMVERQTCVLTLLAFPYTTDFRIVLLAAAVDAPAPKLIAAKLPNPDQMGGVSFSIYDRGLQDTSTRSRCALDSGCHVWYKGYECWANQYDLPSNRWVLLYVTFDCRFLRLYVDGELVDSACMTTVPRSVPTTTVRGSGGGQTIWAAASSSSLNSMYIGGHPSYSRSVRDWRLRIGFVGLLASICMWKTTATSRTGSPDEEALLATDSYVDRSNAKDNAAADHLLVLKIVFADVGRVRDYSSCSHVINVHRNVFWRKSFPPISRFSLSPSGGSSRVVLLDNFFHGAHHDLSTTNAKSFENLLLSVLQAGDVRIVVKYALDWDMQAGNERGCRTKKEYEQKSLAVIRDIESMSSLLTVVVNEDGGEPTTACIGSFEIAMLLTRTIGKEPIALSLHSMASTSSFPNPEEIKKKILSIILHEAKRSPGEEVYDQAFRHFLALAGRSRQNRERVFLEAVTNRKIVLTERKIVSVFQKIGFHFANSELLQVVRYFKHIQDEHIKKRNRMEDLPTLSMLTPTAGGLYSLPFLDSLSICTTLDCEGSVLKSPWRFIGILLDYDFQLLEYIHEDCPVTLDRKISLHQTRYLYGGFVNRVNLKLSQASSRVYCILFCLQKVGYEEDAPADNGSAAPALCSKRDSRVRIQIENGESLQVLGIYDTFPERSCRWFALAALYRSKRLCHWTVQALGGGSQANSIHAGLEAMHELLVGLGVVQLYEVVVHFESGMDDKGCEYEEYAKRFSKNIRFGRNGRIAMNPIAKSGNSGGESTGRRASLGTLSPLVISLKLQGSENEVEVYRHESSHRTLPTIQSIYRTILRILAEHGIKESLQHSPFVAQEKQIKRQVEIKVINEHTNSPVEKAHVFIEKNLDNVKLATSLAEKIVPTLTMGSRLVSIRRRLQSKRASDGIKAVAAAFVDEVVSIGTKFALSSLRRDSKIVPYIRSRAVVKRAMRRRYEKSKQRILEQVEESERGRIYSRNGPIRLKQLYQCPLAFSASEKELLEEFSAFGLEAFSDESSVALHAEHSTNDPNSGYEIWRAQRVMVEDTTSSDLVTSPERNGDDNDDTAHAGVNPSADPNGAIQASLERARQRKKCYVTDASGQVSCRLSPGSYSLYIFHLDYFEWTSLVVVFPSANGFGAQGETGTSCALAQNILVPLEAFRWTYRIQLVDFYDQNQIKMVANISIQVVDKVTSERYTVKTDERGCAMWDVGKGLYSVSASKECTCVLYSASRNVVVEGGRYRPAKTIHIPVLIGKLTIGLVVAAAIPPNSRELSVLAKIRIDTDEQERMRNQSDAVPGESRADIPARGDETLAIGSSLNVPLRPGKYDIEISAPSFYTSHLHAHVGWNSSTSNSRYLVVLSPTFRRKDSYRVVFSYVNAVKSMEAIIEVFKDQIQIGDVWRQSHDTFEDQVVLDQIAEVDGCEHQSFTLNCRNGTGFFAFRT